MRTFRPSAPFGLLITYAVVGLAWIVLTDRFVARYGADSDSLQTLKGLAFLAITSAFMYIVLVRRRAGASDAAAADRVRELSRSADDVKAAQIALAQSERRLRRLIETSLDAIITVASDDLVLEWNEQAERMFGFSRAEAIGEKLAELIIPPAERDRYIRLLRRLSTDSGPASGAVRLETAAADRIDRAFPIEMTIAPVEVGNQVIFTMFIRDISERVGAAQEAQFIKAVVNAAPFAITGVDEHGRILSWNPAAEEMYGWKADEVCDGPISLLFPDDSPDLAPLLDRVRLGVEVEAEQGEHLRRDGRRISVVRTLAPLPPVDGARRSALISIDLSERQQLERRLSDAEYLASLGRLAGTVAHEFNNVLMGIQSFIEVIERRAERTEAVERAVGQIRLSIQRGRGITEDILRFTRATIDPALHAINVDEWLNDIGMDLEDLVAPHATVRIDTAAPGLQVIGDHGQLYQVLMNLALNAKDAMPGGGEIRISSAPAPPPAGAPPREPGIEISVSDTGIGMDAQTATHAFEPLFTTKKRGGTGLGLAVVQKIVRAHGGEVSVTSDVNAGSTFCIRLPARHGIAGEEAPAAPRSFAPRRILLVEDDLAVAAGLADVLRSYDMTVDVLHSGAHVVEAIGRFRPDVVVLDVGLPDRSGVDVFHDIEAAHPDVPVLFSTGHADEARLDKPLSRSNVGFLRKPYAIESLLEQIEELVG